VKSDVGSDMYLLQRTETSNYSDLFYLAAADPERVKNLKSYWKQFLRSTVWRIHQDHVQRHKPCVSEWKLELQTSRTYCLSQETVSMTSHVVAFSTECSDYHSRTSMSGKGDAIDWRSCTPSRQGLTPRAHCMHTTDIIDAYALNYPYHRCMVSFTVATDTLEPFNATRLSLSADKAWKIRCCKNQFVVCDRFSDYE